MARVETVDIWHPEAGRMKINASDFDPDKHERYRGEAEVEPEEPVEADTGTDPRYWLERSGSWFKVMGREEGKIGKATQDEDEANTRLRELIAEDFDE